jgi:hypothetical protein
LHGTLYVVECPIVVLPSARAAVAALRTKLAHVLTSSVCPRFLPDDAIAQLLICGCGPSVENLKNFCPFNRHSWNNKGGAV